MTGWRLVRRDSQVCEVHGEGRVGNALQSLQRSQIPSQNQRRAPRHQTRESHGNPRSISGRHLGFLNFGTRIFVKITKSKINSFGIVTWVLMLSQVSDHEDGSKSLKLGDFGLATECDGPLYTVCGTPTYVAPEVIAEEGCVGYT